MQEIEKSTENKNRNLYYYTLCNKVEVLFDSEDYKEVIHIVNANPNINFQDKSKDNYEFLAEIISVSYLELGIFSKALLVIDNCILYLTENGINSSNKNDDLTNFILIKMEIYERSNSLLKQFKTALKYVNLGGTDPLVLDWKHDTEEKLFLKYVSIIKYFTYFLILLMFIDIIGLFYFEKSFSKMIIYIGTAWILMNYLFHKIIRVLFVKILNILY